MKTNRRNFFRTAAAGIAAASLADFSAFASTENHIRRPEPERKGKSVMGLACEPLKTVRIGLVGLGMRGLDTLERLMFVEGVEVTAICDVIPERVAKGKKAVTKAKRKEPVGYSKGEEDWKNLCERDDVDLVYSCTPWLWHTPVSVYAMKHGKHAATEVPAAMTVEDCWELVNTAEETQKHCMMLENCCYDFFELNTLNMARKGVFGEIMYGEGAYIHDLRWLKFDRVNGYAGMWRLKYNMTHNGNPYPTHGLGPVAQIMCINRGDRMDYLNSISTNQVGMTLYAEEKFGSLSPDAIQPYALGDMNTTVIRTVNGKTIMVQHDTTSPRPYSRIHMISGTKGMARKWPVEQVALEPKAHTWLKKKDYGRLMKEYEHPLAAKIGKTAKKVGGHGGMDYIMDSRLSYCLRKGLPLDQDVYDAAAWSSVIELSSLSVNNRGNSVDMPDFTRGEWKDAKPLGIVTMD
ncbi:MAG: Gfo/Idh/MocA family oxidoreductase [Bacteroidota bacterium]